MGKAPLPTEFNGFPVVTAARMQEIDRRAIREYRLAARWLMENAGKAVAGEVVRFAKETLGRDAAGLKVVAMCGRGNNGGDGLVAARLLREIGGEPRVVQAADKKDRPYSLEVAENREALAASGVECATVSSVEGVPAGWLDEADVVVDAVLGTGSAGKPAAMARVMIQAVTRSKKPVVAVDVPSGLHPDTGYHGGVFVSAALTVALGLPKRGLLAPHAAKNVGELVVADIGLPKELLKS